MMIAPTLRKSILQAAISGRLTEQRAEDGDARDLLAAIRKEKTRLVREGKLKKEKALPAITEDEVPFEIPENWCWARFGDIMQFVSTGPFGTMLHKEDYVTNGTPLVNPMNMRDGNIIPSQNKSVSKETCERLTSYRLHEDDLVFARRGELGRCARVTKKRRWLSVWNRVFLRASSWKHPAELSGASVQKQLHYQLFDGFFCRNNHEQFEPQYLEEMSLSTSSA